MEIEEDFKEKENEQEQAIYQEFKFLKQIGEGSFGKV